MKLIISVLALVAACSFGKAEALQTELYEGKTVRLLDMSHITQSQYTKMQSTMSEDFFIEASDLGMANVPVLDQGAHGTCVTFATTAALDAKFALGDFISQQCSLQLNKSLGTDGWDGLYTPSQVIDPLQKYGVVSQSRCNARYPARNTPISVDEYKKRIDKSVSESVSQVKYTYYNKNNLSALKSAISSGKRVLIAFLLNPNKAQGFDLPGKRGGLWSCSASDVKPEPTPDLSEYEKCKLDFPDFPQICDWFYGQKKAVASECGRFNAGHEVLSYGFDDAKQLLKIRNSWGTSVGESGEFYMSYEYFSKQVVDMTVIF